MDEKQVSRIIWRERTHVFLSACCVALAFLAALGVSWCIGLP
jgi:hypothetical protein